MIMIQSPFSNPPVRPVAQVFGKTSPLETRAQFGLFKNMFGPTARPSGLPEQSFTANDAPKNPLQQLGVLFYLLPKAMQDALTGGEFMVLQRGAELFVLPIPQHGNGKTATVNLMA